MNISVTFDLDVDVEGWAKISNISTEDAAQDIFAWLGRMDLGAGQTFVTQECATVMEEKL